MVVIRVGIVLVKYFGGGLDGWGGCGSDSSSKDSDRNRSGLGSVGRGWLVVSLSVDGGSPPSNGGLAWRSCSVVTVYMVPELSWLRM